MSMKSQEAAKLRSLMTSMRVSDLPKPGELHSSHADFMRFNHRSFLNVYNNVKKQMAKSHESVPPDSDEEEEEGEFGVVLYHSFTNFSLLNSPLLLPLSLLRLQDSDFLDFDDASPPKTERAPKGSAV